MPSDRRWYYVPSRRLVLGVTAATAAALAVINTAPEPVRSLNGFVAPAEITALPH